MHAGQGLQPVLSINWLGDWPMAALNMALKALSLASTVHSANVARASRGAQVRFTWRAQPLVAASWIGHGAAQRLEGGVGDLVQ